MAVNIPGVLLMVLFYLLVLGTGIWASFKSKREKRKSGANDMEMTLLGNRSINWVLGIFTMTDICCALIHPAATWVGGGFIVGTAEMVYTPSMGLTWAAMVMVDSQDVFLRMAFMSSTLQLRPQTEASESMLNSEC